MKRLLLPLIAALALPTAASAESIYLLVNFCRDGCASHKVLMKSMAECELTGAKLLSSKRFKGPFWLGYECILGK